MKVKLALVPIQPKVGNHAITPYGVVEVLGILPEGGYKILSAKGSELNHYGTMYTMVGYNPDMEEEHQFIPVEPSQWRLLTKFIPRDHNNAMLPNLSHNGVPHNLPWTEAFLTPNGYVVYKRVEL